VIDDPTNGGSEPGSYADALRYPHSIRVSEYRALPTLPSRAEPSGTAEINPLAVPPFSDDRL